MVSEFKRDLYEPVLEIKSRLQTSGIAEDQLQKWDDFLDAAALCDPTIPVHPLLRMVSVTEEGTDDFIEWLDDLF